MLDWIASALNLKLFFAPGVVPLTYLLSNSKISFGKSLTGVELYAK